MKPKIINEIEGQIGLPLEELARLEERSDSIRYENNNSYVMEEGRLVALNVTGSDLLTRVKFDEDVCESLIYLNLSGNSELAKVKFSDNLPMLRYLDLSECALERLRLPSGCRRLEKIWLQHNKLSHFDFSDPCPSLMLLDLSHNQLEEIYFPFGFESLAHLYVVDNRLEEIEFAGEKQKVTDASSGYLSPVPLLETLHLRGNRLESVPTAIVFSEKLNVLYLSGNVPKNIPRIFLLGESTSLTAHNCLPEARTWFTELRNGKHEKNLAVKLMLLGNSNVGKSTLAHSLDYGSCDEKKQTTHGIIIDTIEKDEITYNVWDFGGQEVYHGTHRLFMSAEALQVIVFDSETEKDARNQIEGKDRALEGEKVLPHPIEYWYETTFEKSENSQFFMVQNLKNGPEANDRKIEQYASDKAHFHVLNAWTGEGVEDLSGQLKKMALELPDFGMEMPEAWLEVRRYFVENLQNPETKEYKKYITRAEFDTICVNKGVSEKTRPLLFKYLHHYGFLYTHNNLKEKVIVDQRWALDAIYKPYDKESDHYRDFFEMDGKIPGWKLFKIFGDSYNSDEKRLFLEFMESCGLCFQLNVRSEQGKLPPESAYYVFPEFLPEEKPKGLESDWKRRAQEVHVLRYELVWCNYYVIQSFITTLGRKTETDLFWRYGIHVSIPDEGWFKVELQKEKGSNAALVLHIERRIMGKWLIPILDELNVRQKEVVWEIWENDKFVPFLPEKMKEENREFPVKQRNLEVSEQQDDWRVSVTKDIDDVQQKGRSSILFVGANPEKTPLLGTIEKEMAHIFLRAKKHYDVEPVLEATKSDLNDGVERVRPKILHFCGHAEPNGLLLHDQKKRDYDEFKLQQLEYFFGSMKKDCPELKIVFLNACSSEQLACTISQYGLYAIGMKLKINSLDAMKFAEGFYSSYARYDDVEKAVGHGKREVVIQGNMRDFPIVTLYYNGKQILML